MIKKLTAAMAFFSLLETSAFATCTNPLTILNSVSASVNMSVSQNTADAGCMYNITPMQGGAALSATNGWYTNVLQGNVALSTGNPIFTQITAGGAAIGSIFGPTPVGSANANPPVVVGGTATGAAGQNVQGLSVVAPSTAPTTAGNSAAVFDLRPDSPGIIALGPATTALSLSTTQNSQYPTNSVTTTPTAITGNSTGTTGAVVGTLAAAASKTTFICGFSVSAAGGVASVGPITIAGLIGSSQVYQLFSTATGANLVVPFSPCIPASAANTAITITTTADATASAVDVNSWGYQL
jgi:hypothetical protein